MTWSLEKTLLLIEEEKVKRVVMPLMAGLLLEEVKMLTSDETPKLEEVWTPVDWEKILVVTDEWLRPQLLDGDEAWKTDVCWKMMMNEGEPERAYVMEDIKKTCAEGHGVLMIPMFSWTLMDDEEPMEAYMK